MDHTQEPWKQDGYFVESGYEGNDPTRIGTVADCRPYVGDSSPEADANARRIVACVNALQGVPTDYLEKLPAGALADMVEAVIHKIP